MYIIGLTGPSGAGKGTVAEMFEEYGFYHIDTDRISHDILPDALPELTSEFGMVILNNDGSVNRQKLADYAFKDDESTEKLNFIMHKKIMQKVSELIDVFEKRGGKFVIIDGAALFEAGAEKLCDKIVSVISSEKTRLKRIILRDGISENQALSRFSRQKSLEYFMEKSDYIIENNESDDYETLKNKVYSLLKNDLKII